MKGINWGWFTLLVLMLLEPAMKLLPWLVLGALAWAIWGRSR